MQTKIKPTIYFYCSRSGTKMEIYSNTGQPKETRKLSNKKKLHLKEMEK